MRTRGSSLPAMCAHFSLAQELVSERGRGAGRERRGRGGGAAAPPTHRRRHKPRGDLTKEAGRGRGWGETTGPTGPGRTQPPIARRGGARSRRRNKGSGPTTATGGEGGTTAARTRPARGHTCALPPRGERGRGPPGAQVPAAQLPRSAAAEGWGSQRRVPRLPPLLHPTKGGTGRRRRCPAAALCAPHHHHHTLTPPHTPHPRVTVVSNGLICSPARSSSIAAPPRSPGKGKRNGRREADARAGAGARRLPGGGGRRWCPQDGTAATAPPRRGGGVVGGEAEPRPTRRARLPPPRARPAAPPANGEGAHRPARRRPRVRPSAPTPPPPLTDTHTGRGARGGGGERCSTRSRVAGGPRLASAAACPARRPPVTGARGAAPEGEPQKGRVGGSGAARWAAGAGGRRVGRSCRWRRLFDACLAQRPFSRVGNFCQAFTTQAQIFHARCPPRADFFNFFLCVCGGGGGEVTKIIQSFQKIILFALV